MRRFFSLLTAVCVLAVCFVSAMLPVSAQAATLYQPIDTDRALRQDLILQMDTNPIDVPTSRWRDLPIELPPIPRPEIVCKLMPIDPENYYGRQILAASDNPDLVKAYDHFGREIKAFKQAVNFKEFRVTAQEAATIYYYYRNDHPEVFWLPTKCEWFSFGYSTTTGLPNIVLTYEFAVPKEEIPALQQQLEARTEEFLDGITGNMTEEKREQLVLKRLNAAAVYDHSMQEPHDHDALGVLLYGTGVCESYARAFQYLMYRCGIQCLYVVGDTVDGSHAWNMVNIDGEWLMVDPTGCDNDIDDEIELYFYNFTYAEFLEKSWYTGIKTGAPYYYPLPI